MFGAWIKLVVNSAAVAALMVAAQLGVGDALGILDWDSTPQPQSWPGLLTWLAFCYAAAVIVGALVGRIPVRRSPRGEDLGSRLVASLAASAGAAAVIGLAWLRAHQLHPPTNVNPGLVISLTAGAGAVAGFILALVALSAWPLAAGIEAMIGWLWLLAIVSAAAGVATHEPYPAPRLGVPDAPSLLPDALWSGPRIMIAAAAVIGLVVAIVARAQGAHRVAAAFAGLAGPATLAAAYLMAGPGSGPDRDTQAQPWQSALLAVAAGLVVSVLVAIPGRRAPRSAARRAAGTPGALGAAGALGALGTDEPARSTARPVERSGPLEGDVVTPAPRPAWASTSGGYGGGVPYAGAFAGGGTAAGTATVPAPPTAAEPPPVPPTRGTGWDGDTWPGRLEGIGGAQSGRGRPAAEDPHESWLRDLGGGSGRHSAG